MCPEPANALECPDEGSEARGRQEQVVITGYGVRSAASIDESLGLVARGETKIAEHELSDSGGVRCIGAIAPGDAPLEYLPQRKWLKYMGPSTQLAVWAAGRALADAGLSGPDAAPLRREMALLLATGPIAFELADVVAGLRRARASDGSLDYEVLGTEGLRAVSPMMPFHTLLNMPIGLVSMCFGLEGHGAVYYPDLEQSGFALEAAVRGIRRGRYRAVLVGGTAKLMSLMPLANLRRNGMVATTPEAGCPWSPVHRGWAPGDGAAMIVLESASRARSRGARIYGMVRVEPAWAGGAAPSGECDLSVVTGTRSVEEDVVARHAAGRAPCLSFDGIVGFLGPAALPWCLAAACRLAERPALYGAGDWCRGGAIRVLAAIPELALPPGLRAVPERGSAGSGSRVSWASVDLETAS